MRYDLLEILKEKISRLNNNNIASIVLKEFIIDYYDKVICFDNYKSNIDLQDSWNIEYSAYNVSLYNFTSEKYSCVTIDIENKSNFIVRFFNILIKDQYYIEALNMYYNKDILIKSEIGSWTYNIDIKEITSYIASSLLKGIGLNDYFQELKKMQKQLHKEKYLLPDSYKTLILDEDNILIKDYDGNEALSPNITIDTVIKKADIEESSLEVINKVRNCFMENDILKYESDDNYSKVLRHVQKNNIKKLGD